MNDELIYSNNKPVTKNLVSSRKIISGIAKDKPIEGYISRTYLSTIKEKNVYSYFYFGGYTGDGDVTMMLKLPHNYTNVSEVYMEFQIDDSFGHTGHHFPLRE